MNDTALQFLLGTTSDPDVAASTASSLGEDACAVTLRVPLPTPWVRAAIKEYEQNSAIAVFAASHADDDVVREIILSSPDYTVIDALRKNPFLQKESRDLLQVSTTRSDHEDELYEKIAVLPRDASTDIGHCSLGLTQFANRPSVLNTALGMLAERGCYRYCTDYLLHWYGVRKLPTWKKAALTPSELLSRVHPGIRTSVATVFLQMILTTEYKKTSPRRIDEEVLRMVMGAVDPQEVAPGNTHANHVHDAFTAGALSLLCTTPSWAHLVRYQTLNEDLMKFLIVTTPVSATHELATLVGDSTTLARLVLDALPPSGALSVEEFTALMGVPGKSSDPLFAEVIGRASPKAVLHYLTKGVLRRGKVLFPKPSHAQGLLARTHASAATPKEDRTLVDWDFHVMPRDLARELLCNCPGALGWILLFWEEDEFGGHARLYEESLLDLSRYAFDTLEATGAQPSVIVDQLFANPLGTLTQTREHLEVLMRARSAS
jgi:hypothetical protein